MAIWDRLIRKMVGPVVDESIKELNLQLVEDEINKRLKPNIQPWEYNPVITDEKTKKKQYPSGVDFTTLRNFSVFYPIARACVNYRKAQITQLSWDISPIELDDKKKEDKGTRSKVKELKGFFRYPVGDNVTSFREFLDRIMEDMLVIDAMAIYRRRNRANEVIGYLPVDGATIELKINRDGTIPLPPEAAYVQKIKDFESEPLTTDDLIYKVMNPRTHDPYGLSPLETLILIVSTALKLQAYNLYYLLEGNVPEGFVELPRDIAGSRDQLKDWQDSWDKMLSGDPRFQRKLKFLPEGMKYHPTRKAEEMSFERFEKWLLLNTAAVFAVPPQAIGFQFDRGKGATEAEWEIGRERGLFPAANFLKEVFDKIIQEDFGHDDLQFVWTNINPTNAREEAQVFDTLVRTGAISVDEWRIAEGYDPIGLPHYIMSPVGPILAKDLVEQSEQGVTPLSPYQQQQQGVPQPKVPSGKEISPDKGSKIDLGGRIQDASRMGVAEELKRWKKVALNDLKLERDFRSFKTDIIDSRTQEMINRGLESVSSREDIAELFDPFISSENKVVSAVIDLYDDVNRVVADKTKKD